MAKEITAMDKLIVIEEMLTKMGYDTTGMSVSQALEIMSATVKAIDKTKLPLNTIYPMTRDDLYKIMDSENYTVDEINDSVYMGDRITTILENEDVVIDDEQVKVLVVEYQNARA